MVHSLADKCLNTLFIVTVFHVISTNFILVQISQFWENEKSESKVINLEMQEIKFKLQETILEIARIIVAIQWKRLVVRY